MQQQQQPTIIDGFRVQTIRHLFVTLQRMLAVAQCRYDFFCQSLLRFAITWATNFETLSWFISGRLAASTDGLCIYALHIAADLQGCTRKFLFAGTLLLSFFLSFPPSPFYHPSLSRPSPFQPSPSQPSLPFWTLPPFPNSPSPAQPSLPFPSFPLHSTLPCPPLFSPPFPTPPFPPLP